MWKNEWSQGTVASNFRSIFNGMDLETRNNSNHSALGGKAMHANHIKMPDWVKKHVVLFLSLDNFCVFQSCIQQASYNAPSRGGASRVVIGHVRHKTTLELKMCRLHIVFADAIWREFKRHWSFVYVIVFECYWWPKLKSN